VVDNSSAYRLDPNTPLVVPEVNGELLDDGPMLVANPNCSTILLLLAVEPVRRAFGVRSVIASTYQAVSGAGRAAVEELFSQTRDVLDGKAPSPSAFPVPCAFNVFPHESAVDRETGLNVEESKIIAESRKILALPGLDISPTCVRVPVERCHSQSVTIELERPATRGAVVELFASFPGVAINADPAALVTPRDIAGSDLISISRPRLSRDGLRLSLWTCGDQLRKGAALNAVQIAERLAAVSVG
jgi:aspartate-semialdehyde dehydrogenase